MKTCAQRERNMAQCTCTYEPCPRKGICCECVSYHRRNGEMPACFFDAEGERTWDRSIANFMRRQRTRS